MTSEMLCDQCEEGVMVTGGIIKVIEKGTLDYGGGGGGGQLL
jgi:hypothetical protein